MTFCKHCPSVFDCPKAKVQLVSDRKLEDPEYLRDLRAFTANLNISPDHWLDYLTDTYRDYCGRIVSGGRDIYLDMEVFEVPYLREWFRDFTCTPVRDGVCPRPRADTRERVRVLATLLSTRFPFAASLWSVRAANDNYPPAENK